MQSDTVAKPAKPDACTLQVVAEVYAAQDVVVKPHILLSLVLYKIVDPAQVALALLPSGLAATCLCVICVTNVQDWPMC